MRLAPVSIQEEIAGTDIRAFVAGDRVLACEISTSAIDFRNDAAQRIVPHRLSPDQEATCRAIARMLQLVWTGIDFRLAPNGEYVFLEANPSPMFLDFEERSGLPLTESLAALLLETKI
jgi:glutathione synthase/RimK-type ligase-like ATP-grasp enzyme